MVQMKAENSEYCLWQRCDVVCVNCGKLFVSTVGKFVLSTMRASFVNFACLCQFFGTCLSQLWKHVKIMQLNAGPIQFK